MIYGTAETVTKGFPHQDKTMLCTTQIQALSHEPEANLWDS